MVARVTKETNKTWKYEKDNVIEAWNGNVDTSSSHRYSAKTISSFRKLYVVILGLYLNYYNARRYKLIILFDYASNLGKKSNDQRGKQIYSILVACLDIRKLV